MKKKHRNHVSRVEHAQPGAPQPFLTSYTVEVQILGGLSAQQVLGMIIGISRPDASSRGRVVQHECMVRHFQADSLLDRIGVLAILTWLGQQVFHCSAGSAAPMYLQPVNDPHAS